MRQICKHKNLILLIDVNYLSCINIIGSKSEWKTKNIFWIPSNCSNSFKKVKFLENYKY